MNAKVALVKAAAPSARQLPGRPTAVSLLPGTSHSHRITWIPSFPVVALLLAWPAWVWPQSVSTTVSVGNSPRAVAVNKTTNKIYVANYLGGNLTVIDGATNTVTTVPTGARPLAVAVNEATNKIYVVNGYYVCWFRCGQNGSITVIDGATNTTTTATDPNARNPVALAVNPATNKIYVANSRSNNVTVIDGASNSTTTITDPNAIGLADVAVNAATNKVYVANRGDNSAANQGNVTVIDGATNAITTVTDPNAVAPSSVRVNSTTNRIYVANGGNFPAANHGNVTIIDGGTNATTTVTDPKAVAPNAVAVNQTTDTIYVTSASDSAQDGSGVVTVIDGASNATTTVAVPNAQIPAAVAVNETMNTVYVAGGSGSNPGSVTVIDGSTNTATSIIDPKAANPDAVAINPNTDQIYVANQGSSNVTVIDGGGAETAHILAVVSGGGGSGGVTSAPAGINCGASCDASFANGTKVSLTATAESGSLFSGWGGPCSGNGACQITMNEDQYVTALFNIQDTVPNVVGLTQTAATTAITGAGLVVGTVTQQFSSTVASGNVISESPGGGAQVAAGSAVNLVLSYSIPVPEVRGFSQATAASTITKAGLVVGSVTQQSSSTVAGYVISETPAAGTNVAGGSAVSLVVSSGPAADSGGGGGGGGIDLLTLVALLGSLAVGLGRARGNGGDRVLRRSATGADRIEVKRGPI